MSELTAETPVPCNGCKACCRDQIVILDDLDDPSLYETEPVGDRLLQIKSTSNGDCIYLAPGGCSIYETRPSVCRAFDCRKAYLINAAAGRTGPRWEGPVTTAGLMRLGSLSDAEKREVGRFVAAQGRRR